MAKNLDRRDAKQGTRGRHVLMILIAGLALIVVGYLIVGSIGVATSPDGTIEQETGNAAPEANQQDQSGDVVPPEGAEEPDTAN